MSGDDFLDAAIQQELPLPSPRRPSGSPLELGAALARDHFAAIEGGVVRSPEDFLAALAVAASPVDDSGADSVVAGARVRLERMGLPLSFSPERRSQLLLHVASVLGGTGLPIPEVAERVSALAAMGDERLAAERVEAERIYRRVLPLLPPGAALLPHQRDALRMIEARSFRALVHDDQGLGKTIEVLCAILLRSLDAAVFPILIVSTASVAGMWVDHSARWLQALSPVVRRVATWSPSADDPDLERLVLVCSYQRMVERCADLRTIRFSTVVFDESHHLSSPDSLRSRSAILVRGGARGVICATGTMQPNGRPIECLVSLRLLDPSSRDLEPRAYRRTYCAGRWVVRGRRKYYDDRGASNLVPFGRLIDRYSFRRTKAELGDQLPEKIRYRIPVELSEEDRLEIAALRDEVDRKIRERIAECGDPLSLPEGPKREALEAKIGLVEGARRMSEMQRIRVVTGLAKIPIVVERTLENLADGHRCVLFCQFKEVQEKLFAELSTALQYPDLMQGTSELSERSRTKLVKDANDKASVLVLSSAFSVGITLTAFDVAGIVDRQWVPDVERQEEDRLHRIGQVKTVYVEYYCAPGTTDDAMEEIHWTKEGRSGAAVGSGYRRAYEWLAVRPG